MAKNTNNASKTATITNNTTLTSAHTHTINTSNTANNNYTTIGTHGGAQTSVWGGISGSSGSAGFGYSGSISASPRKGDFRFDQSGVILCYDGTAWVEIAGLEHETKLDKIRKELRENFPEALFDLVMKDLL